MNASDLLENGIGTRLFVYGTLRKGFRSHGLLQRFHPKFHGAGHVVGRLYDLGEYPGAVEDQCSKYHVQGELYGLPRAEMALKVLDSFEGFHSARPAPSEFERKETTVTIAGAGKMCAWIYWVSPAHASGRRIISGDYTLHRK